MSGAFIVAGIDAILGRGSLGPGYRFPIKKLRTDLVCLVAAHEAAAATLPTEDRDNIFWNTAERVYRPAWRPGIRRRETLPIDPAAA
nr:hypothetical protein [Mesorhizobium sp.]